MFVVINQIICVYFNIITVFVFYNLIAFKDEFLIIYVNYNFIKTGKILISVYTNCNYIIFIKPKLSINFFTIRTFNWNISIRFFFINVYKLFINFFITRIIRNFNYIVMFSIIQLWRFYWKIVFGFYFCLLYTSDAADEL